MSLASGRYAEPRRSESHLVGGIVFLGFLVFLGLLFLTILFGSWYTIDQSQRGVILRNGHMVGIAQPGLGFKMPMVDSVIKFSTLTKVVHWDKIASYSRDQQPADIVASVNYHIPADQVENFYTTFGYDEEAVVDNLIRPRVYQQLKDTFGQYTAQEAIQQRAKLNKEVQDAVLNSISNRPVLIDSVQIENIDFSDAYEKAVEDRMTAEVAVAKQRQTLEKEKIEAQIALTQATGRANSVRAEADARAYAAKVQGDAEASAIEARGKALKDNPDLPRLVQAERWNGKLPNTMIPGGAVPFISIEKQ